MTKHKVEFEVDIAGAGADAADVLSTFAAATENAVTSVVDYAASLVETAIATLTESGILVDADNGHRPVFRNGHLEHVAREWVRLGHERVVREYTDDLLVAERFYADELAALVCAERGE